MTEISDIIELRRKFRSYLHILRYLRMIKILIASAYGRTAARARDGKTLITDGPFAETHEQWSGYFILDCKDLDETIGWAPKIPGAKFASVEVRPVMAPPVATYTQA
ncbi:MAG TPA: YciI family protein [Anaerolineales bacterium]